MRTIFFSEVKKNYLAFLMILPAFLFLLTFVVHSLFWAFRLSFYEVSLLNLAAKKFILFENYKEFFQDPVFFTSFKASFYFVVGSCSLQLIFGLLIAILVNQKWVRGKTLFSLVFMIPWISSVVVVAYSWMFMYDPRVSLFNIFLRRLGLSPPPWLADTGWAMPSVIISDIWWGTSLTFLIQSSGIQSIPPSLHEVALVDGASWRQQHLYITLPLLKPFILLNLILITVYTFNNFGVILILTNGGPLHVTEIFSLFTYHKAFTYNKVGYASSLTVLMFGINLCLVAMYIRMFRGRGSK